MHRWLKRLFLVGVGATAVCLLLIAVQVYRFGELDEARPADAAVVLGAAVFRERPSPVLRERINHAILLYEQGYVKTIIFTGGLGDRDSLTEAEVARQYALARGVPDEAILMETTSTNTAENLANTKSLAEAQGLHSFLIVSTPFHMKRALAIADALEMEAYTSPTRTIQWISWATKTRAFVREVGAYAVYLVSWQG